MKSKAYRAVDVNRVDLAAWVKDRDEGLVGSRAEIVHRSREHLLACSALAEQQAGHAGRRELFHHAADGQHARIGRDHAIERRTIG